jgi:hypothetical protein
VIERRWEGGRIPGKTLRGSIELWPVSVLDFWYLVGHLSRLYKRKTINRACEIVSEEEGKQRERHLKEC